MHSDYSRNKINKQIREDILEKVRQNLAGLLSQNIEQVEALLNETSTTIFEGNIEEALKNYTDQVRNNLPEAEKEETEKADEVELPWLKQLKTSMEGVLVEWTELEQEEERFQKNESDSATLGLGKWVKRSTRAVQSGLNKTRNTFRKLFKKAPKPAPVWKQEIPLKNLVGLHLLELSTWVENWKNELEKVQAETLVEVDARTLHASGLVKVQKEQAEEENNQERQQEEAPEVEQTPTGEDIKTFFKEALDEVKAIEIKYTELLDEQITAIENEIQTAISITGTIERSQNEYAEAELKNKEQIIRTREQKLFDSWDVLHLALVNRCSLSMDFIGLYQQVKERVGGFGASLEEFFDENIESHIEQLFVELQAAIAIFDSSGDRSLKEVSELSSGHRDKMKEHIEQQLLNPLRVFVEDAVLSTKFERFTSAIPEWTNNLPEKAVLIEKLDMTVAPPNYEFEKVDWQSLVRRVINNQMANSFLPKEIKAEQFLMEVIQGFHEISQIIYTNLEIADEVKKSDEEEPVEVAREGLKRAETKLTELQAKVAEKREHLQTMLTEKQEAAFSKLAMLLEKQDVSDVRLAGAQYMAKETAVDWKTRLQVKWAVIEEKAELFGRFIWMKIKNYYKIIQKFLGFAEKEKIEGDKTDLATFLSETEEKIATLPFIYRRLFDFHKEVDDRFYIRRPEQFERFKKAYELWQNEFPSTCAIVGEKGAGKSIFIRLLIQEIFTKHEVLEINFKDTMWEPDQVMQKIAEDLKIKDVENLEDLIDAIGRKKKRTVVMLENIQNCYIRNISGFEALEQLMLLISETNKNILWVTSCTRYGWLFLDKVMNVGDYYTHTVETDNLSPEQIKQLVIKRHTASGYQLKFISDEATKKSRAYKKVMNDEEKTQELIREKYFEKLAKLSEGNSSIAMIYWIRSIREFDDTHFYISPFEFGAIQRIEELDSNELFSLAAFVLHDSLNAKELALIIHKPERECKLTLSRLASQAILVKNEQGLGLNQLIYRQVVRALKEANYIH